VSAEFHMPRVGSSEVSNGDDEGNSETQPCESVQLPARRSRITVMADLVVGKGNIESNPQLFPIQ